ncbi:MAG: radical SAM protein [Phycisphaerae bacterium]
MLIVQFGPPGPGDALPVFSNSLGILAALLKREGIQTGLAAFGGHHSEAVRAALARHLPDCVLVDINPYSATAAHRTIADIAQMKLPVVVCGHYATCRPTKAVSIPGVSALLLGEYDNSGPDLFKAIRDGRSLAGIAGAWVHSDGALVRGPVAPLVEDLDSLPFPERDIFDYARLARLTRQASFKVARGCGNWCASCFNDWYMDLYCEKGRFARRRSVGNVLEEVHSVVARHPEVSSVAFYDHGFAADSAWLGEFADAYPRRCALPFRCFVPIHLVTAELAASLASAHCRWVHTQIGSGSRFIREEILSMHARDDQIVRACGALHDAGLSVTADVFVGSPYESEITVEETLTLLRRCEVDEVRSRVFYPTPGTRAAEVCAENGWISGRGEENYWLEKSVLDMPSLPAARIDAIAAKLPALVGAGHGILGKLIRRIIPPRSISSIGKAKANGSRA